MTGHGDPCSRGPAVHLLLPVLLALVGISRISFAQEPAVCAPEAPAADDVTIVAWYSGKSLRTGTAPGRVATRLHLDVGAEPPESEIPEYVWKTQMGPLRVIAVIRDGKIERPVDTVLVSGQTL